MYVTFWSIATASLPGPLQLFINVAIKLSMLSQSLTHVWPLSTTSPPKKDLLGDKT